MDDIQPVLTKGCLSVCADMGCCNGAINLLLFCNSQRSCTARRQLQGFAAAKCQRYVGHCPTAGGIAAAETASPAPLNAHPPNNKLRSNTEKQFSVLICAFCNLLFLPEVEVNFLWVGFPNPDRLTLAPVLSWASYQTSQGHNLFDPKAQKIVLLKSLFATSYFSPTVYCHWQYDSIFLYVHICYIYSTHVYLPKNHDLLKLAQAPLGQNCQHLWFQMHQLAGF